MKDAPIHIKEKFTETIGIDPAILSKQEDNLSHLAAAQLAILDELKNTRSISTEKNKYFTDFTQSLQCFATSKKSLMRATTEENTKAHRFIKQKIYDKIQELDDEATDNIDVYNAKIRSAKNLIFRGFIGSIMHIPVICTYNWLQYYYNQPSIFSEVANASLFTSGIWSIIKTFNVARKLYTLGNEKKESQNYKFNISQVANIASEKYFTKFPAIIRTTK
ncbi:MAG: hypothetical protein WC707_05165 [Candidatus Babeliaceae bacterium]